MVCKDCFKYTMAVKLFLFCILIVPLSCSVFSDCGSNKGELLDVRVSGCEEKTRCPLVKGSLTSLQIDFKPSNDTDSVKAAVYGKIMGAQLPFLGVNRKACENSGLSCPLDAGKNYTYNNEIDVKKYYPSLEVDVMWKLMNKKDVIVCAMIPAVLV